MHMSIHIRPGHPDDFAALQEIESDAAQTFHEQHTGIASSDGDCTAADFQRALDEATLLVAEDAAGDAVGFLMVWRVDGTAHLREMDVLRSARGLGVGRALLAAAESWAAGAGYRECTLTTFLHVAWNGPFYERLGFSFFTPGDAYPEIRQLCEAEADHFPGHPRGAMRKAL